MAGVSVDFSKKKKKKKKKKGTLGVLGGGGGGGRRGRSYICIFLLIYLSHIEYGNGVAHICLCHIQVLM